MGIVDGASNGMGAGENFVDFNKWIPRRPELQRGDGPWFFDIIDKKFVKRGPASNAKVDISTLVMNRGHFLDRRNYRRIEHFTVLHLPNHPQFRINYNSQDPPPPGGLGGPGGPGGSGGPGGPNGPGGKPPGGKPPGGKPPGGKPPQGGQPPSSSGAGRGSGPTGPTGGAPPVNQLARGGKPAPVVAKTAEHTLAKVLPARTKATETTTGPAAKKTAPAVDSAKNATPVAAPTKKAAPVAAPAKRTAPVAAPAKKAAPVAAPAKRTAPVAAPAGKVAVKS